jgi:peroxiredoxin
MIPRQTQRHFAFRQHGHRVNVMSEADTDYRAAFKRRLNEFGAVGLFFATLLGSGPEARSADRPASLAAVEHYSAPQTSDADLIGAQPADWQARDWVNSQPLTLDSLRGRVVLVRWWTSPGCPFCQASAPALNEFWERYRRRGLMVIGLYHHKSSAPLTATHVAEQAQKLGFEFPVATDPQWATLHRWWLDRNDSGWTSVTMLLDRRGRIRHVHPGGAFFKGEPGYDALQTKIEALLAEPAAP